MMLKIAAATAYVAMVCVNYLANALPINGVTTGQVSEAYPNLFAPAGPTFAIWGVIYLALGAYTVYQTGVLLRPDRIAAWLPRINKLFILSSGANILWIFAWHYDYIGLSLLVIVIILVCLIGIADCLRGQVLSTRDYLLVRLPFSLYFGWITVAVIANVTVLLVRLEWGGFGLPEALWTVGVVFGGALIGTLRLLRDRDIAYGAVLIWAYLGILLKHASPEGHGARYVGVMAAVILCLVGFVLAIGYVARMKTDANATPTPYPLHTNR